MDTQSRQRGFFASKEGVFLLEKNKFDLDLSYEEIAEKATLASDEQVKRLFHPAWNRKVQRDTIDKIARVLELNPADIIATEDLEPSAVPPEPTSVVLQKMLSDIEVDESLEAEDILQEAERGSSVEQILGTNLKAKSIKFGSLTQEA